MDSQIFWDEMKLDTAGEYYVRFLIDTIDMVENTDSLKNMQRKFTME